MVVKIKEFLFPTINLVSSKTVLDCKLTKFSTKEIQTQYLFFEYICLEVQHKQGIAEQNT